MNHYNAVSEQLARIEALLACYQYWQKSAPSPDRLTSNQPFCLDTLQPYEWLQWVLIPRMQRLIADHAPLPANVMITPYYEMVLAPDCPARDALLKILGEFDALLSYQHPANNPAAN